MCKFIHKKLTTLFTLLALSFAVSASEIDTIDVNVVLERDGTAHVSERWSVDVDNSNTEWYISLKNMGQMKVQNFKVYDNDKQAYLQKDSPWDVDRNRDEKAGKCGVNKLEFNDCELCWGVGTSGPHCWTAQYDIEGFVKQYEDGCGFNHTFVNYNLSSGPKFVRTTISMADETPLAYENARIWAFQYKGLCTFENGKVVAVSSEPLSTQNSMIVMCIFPKDMFNSTNVLWDTIGTMKWRALEGSDYLSDYTESDYASGKNVLTKTESEEGWFEGLLLTLIVLIVGGLLIAVGFLVSTLGVIFGLVVLWNVISLRPLRIFLRRKKFMKGAQSPYFRGIPLGGDLNRAFYVLDENNYKVLPTDKDNLYAAYLVRLMRLNAIDIVSTVEDGKVVNRLHIKKNKNNIKNSIPVTSKNENKEGLVPIENKTKNSSVEPATNESGLTESDNTGKDSQQSPQKDDRRDCMKLLYKAIKQAAGENRILEKGELKNYLKGNSVLASNIIAAAASGNVSDTTPQEYQEVVGLKKFLEDFTIINTTDAVEVELWDEYLVFATLFGIADKVLKSFKECCPEYFQLSKIGAQLIDCEGEIVSDFNDYTGITSLGRGIQSWTQTSTSSSSSGGGGYSSSGGGGGSSGGGGGGGGR